MLKRPEETEYHANFKGYIDLVPEGNLIDILLNQIDETKKFCQSLTSDQGNYKYAEDKWTIKEVLGHMADTERVMSYRLFAIARGETANLPSFDQDIYAANTQFNELELHQILFELSNVRQSTLSLLSTLSSESLLTIGTVNNTPTSARAMAYVIAGHELHHLNILKERYI